MLPDLQIGAADISGGAGELLVVVHNDGLRPSMQTTIAVDGGSGVPTDGGEYTAVVPALAAGEEMTVSVNVPDGSATYGLKVDPLNQVEEVSESNNGAIGTVTVTAVEELIYLPVILRD